MNDAELSAQDLVEIWKDRAVYYMNECTNLTLAVKQLERIIQHMQAEKSESGEPLVGEVLPPLETPMN